MPIEVTGEPMPGLAEYASVPISFQVRLVLDAVELDGGLGGLMLTERAVDIPYLKDYDLLDGPETWDGRFDLRNWGWIAAREGGRRVGGAAVAFDTPGLDMLQRRRDLAVLWDIRVAPDARGRGIGAMLFRAAEAWAVSRGCREMKIETQNVNVPACRFYRRMGCELGGIHRFAYPTLPHEVQLLWHRALAG